MFHRSTKQTSRTEPRLATRSNRVFAAAAVAAVAATGLAACTPAPVPTRYVDITFPEITATTEVTYATAPALVTGTSTALKLDWYAPKGDTLVKRPVIVWVHGGGFAAGSKAAVTNVAKEWAQRGFVTVAINYRLDSGNRCQAIQDGKITDPATLAAETTRCRNAITAAQQYTHAAIRWVRAKASTLKIDTTKVAVGGFLAGAVTAVNVAQWGEKPGTIGDYDTQNSRVSAAIAASGCNYDLATIGTGDAPIYLLASQLDGAVAFKCVTDTEARTKAQGLSVEKQYYYGEGTHAQKLYNKYKAATDAAWSSFLIRKLGL